MAAVQRGEGTIIIFLYEFWRCYGAKGFFSSSSQHNGGKPEKKKKKRIEKKEKKRPIGLDRNL